MSVVQAMKRSVSLVRDPHVPWLEEMRDDALKDLLQGVAMWRLWNHMALSEIKRKYRRTRIGPFWNSINLMIFVAALGVLYSTIFKQEYRTYLPYLTSGMIVWWAISAIITEGSVAYIGSLGLLRQSQLPFSIFAFATVWKNVIIMGHHLVVYALLVAIFGVPVNWNTLLFVPGVVLLCLNGAWVATISAMICSRFRDFQTLLPTLMQLVTLITPVLYPVEALSGNFKIKALFLTPNLFYHFADVVRAPLLGKSPSLLSWALVLGTTAFGWFFTIKVLRRYVNRIMYWL